LSTICRQLKLAASDGKKYATDCANAKGLLRIIQSIPSWTEINRNSCFMEIPGHLQINGTISKPTSALENPLLL